MDKGILERFLIVFGFDDREVTSGAKRVNSVFENLSKTITGLFAGYTLANAFNRMTYGFAEVNTQIMQSTELLGLNAGETQALGNALTRFGGNTESAISSLRSLNTQLEESKRGQGALVEVSKRYGLSFSPFASANDTLISLSKQMGRFSTQQRLVIAQQLGLDDSLTRAFADGGKRLEVLIKKQKELGTITEEDAKITNEFNDANSDLKDTFNALMRDFARVVLPAFTRLVELFSNFIEWVRKHKQLVIIFFTGLLIAMSPILIVLAKMAIASALAFAPFYAILGTLAVVSLIIEDIYGYFMGWDSVTGDLVKQFPILGAILEPIRGIAVGFTEAFEKAVKWLKDPTWEGFIDIIKTIGNTILNFLTKPFEAFYKGFSGWVDSLKNVGNTISGWFGGGDIKANIPDHTQVPMVPPQASLTNNNQQSNINVNNNFNQTISTATPKQFADTTNSQIVSSITDIRQQNGAL